jgi:hypothetical protein
MKSSMNKLMPFVFVTQSLFLLSKDTPDVSNICRYEAVKQFTIFGRRFSALFKLSPKAFLNS